MKTLLIYVYAILLLPNLTKASNMEVIFNPLDSFAYSDATERNGASEAIFEYNGKGVPVFRGSLRGLNLNGRRVGFVGIRKNTVVAGAFAGARVRMVPSDESSRKLLLRLVFRTSATPPPPWEGNLTYQTKLDYVPAESSYMALFDQIVPTVRGVAIDPSTVPRFRIEDILMYAVEARISDQNVDFDGDFSFELP